MLKYPKMSSLKLYTDLVHNLLSLINNAAKIVIFTHQHPDPDAIGSMLALSNLLKAKNSNVVITPVLFESLLPKSQIPQGLSLDSIRVARKESDTKKVKKAVLEADLMFIVDASSYDRVVDNPYILQVLDQMYHKTIIIDHHKTGGSKDALLSFNVQVASCAQLVYEIFVKTLKFPLTTQSALAILFGIMGDTQMLRFLPTNESYVAQYVSELLSFLDKVSPGRVLQNIAKALELKLSLHMVSAFKEAISNLRVNGALAGTFISDVYKSALKDNELGDLRLFILYEILAKMEEIKVYFVVRPDLNKPRRYSVSLRSKGNIDVSLIAQKYGGGGHKNAAGCDINADSAKDAFEIMFKELSSLFEDVVSHV